MLSLLVGSKTVVAVNAVITTASLVHMTSGSVPIASRLIPVRIAVPGGSVVLLNLGADLAAHFAPHLLILLQILAASSRLGHWVHLVEGNVTTESKTNARTASSGWDQRVIISA